MGAGGGLSADARRPGEANWMKKAHTHHEICIENDGGWRMAQRSSVRIGPPSRFDMQGLSTPEAPA